MASKVENDIKELKQEIAGLKLEVERALAVTACQNLMNRYQYYQLRGMRDEQQSLFASKTCGGAVEMIWGVYDGVESIARWKKFEGAGKKRTVENFGGLWMHGMCTPIIEVAADGKTARGLWLMIGAESAAEKGKALWADWTFGQFAMDFIKEGGEWKIWRYNTTGLVYTPFEKGWHVENMKLTVDSLSGKDIAGEKPWPTATPNVPDEFKPDRPATHAYMWRPDTLIENIPPVPLPYKTWDDSLACVPKTKKKA
jgi:hypothetical protein